MKRATLVIDDNVSELKDFLRFSRDLEISIVKSGRSAPTQHEAEDYTVRYWQAVDSLHDRLGGFASEDPSSDPEVRMFLELTLRCEAAWRSRIKPRGYSGDFRLMELFYELEKPFEQNGARSQSKSPGERLIEAAFSRTRGIRLIQKRARVLEAFLLERIGKSAARLRILDVGGGGARYFRRAAGKIGSKVPSYTIIDQDPSLPVFWSNDVPKDIAKNVSVVSASIKMLLNRELSELQKERFDIIMSSGLFDYLEQNIACKLASCLYRLLAEGGTLVIANMLDSEPSQATFFRETLMNWKIVKRTDAEMQGLVSLVEPQSYQRFPDVDLGIAYFSK